MDLLGVFQGMPRQRFSGCGVNSVRLVHPKVRENGELKVVGLDKTERRYKQTA